MENIFAIWVGSSVLVRVVESMACRRWRTILDRLTWIPDARVGGLGSRVSLVMQERHKQK